MSQNNSIIPLIIEFMFIFYFLQAVGPFLDDSFSNFNGSLAPFGAIMRFLIPGPNETLLAFIESLLITAGTSMKL